MLLDEHRASVIRGPRRRNDANRRPTDRPVPVLLATVPRHRLPVLRIVALLLAASIPLAAQRAVGAGRQSDGPRLPFEDAGACPFEGCVYREWVATNAVQVRRDRTTAAPLAFRVRAGEKVTALTGVVVTVRAGRIQFRTAHEALSDGGPIRISAGDTLYLLTYQGEGFSKVWFHGLVYSDVDLTDYIAGDCEPAPGRCAGRLLNRPQSVWWVQIRNAREQVGWTNEPDKFDGKDELGKDRLAGPCSTGKQHSTRVTTLADSRCLHSRARKT